LVLFLSYPERVFSHRELVARVQGYEVSEREAPDIIRPLISRLRRKLTQLPQGRNRIASIRATGYIFKPN
jgi:DNA-binding response OmpR family regulator